MDRVALITGGNAGIGLSVAERLLRENPDIHICLACRNRQKAQSAVQTLSELSPSATVSVVLVDVSDLGSVYKAAAEICKRFQHIDYFFVNAGIMPVSTVDWNHLWKCIFSSRCAHVFRTGEGVLKQVDGTTSDGLKQIFATNLFGHFVLIKELRGLLGGPDHNSQIIWTSSSNAKKESFNFNDLQHQHGSEPYSSSKYASDLISVAINERLNKQGVFSHTTCPGLVMTNLTYGILPSWFWLLLLPLLWLLRLLTPSVTVSTQNGAEALVWLAQQKPESLDPLCKFYSRVSVLGKPYTESLKMNVDSVLASKTFDKLSQLEEELRPLVAEKS